MIPPFFIALIACGLLGFGNYMQWQRGKALHEKAEQATTALESLQEANARLEQAEAVRARELSKLRKAHSNASVHIAAIPDDSDRCLSRDLPADIGLRLAALSDDAAPAKPQPKAGAAVARKDVPRPSTVGR